MFRISYVYSELLNMKDFPMFSFLFFELLNIKYGIFSCKKQIIFLNTENIVYF